MIQFEDRVVTCKCACSKTLLQEILLPFDTPPSFIACQLATKNLDEIISELIGLNLFLKVTKINAMWQ